MKLIIALNFLLLIAGCSQSTQSYLTRTPKFVMQEFFQGELCSWGVIRDTDGFVKRKFIAKIKATQENGVILLDEKFTFNDGELQNRLWKFKQQGTQWIGTAGDVVGEAKAKIYGDSIQLKYKLKIDNDGSEWQINMLDWLHLIDENTLIGTTKMSKWGFNLGRIDLIMRKQPLADCEQS